MTHHEYTVAITVHEKWVDHEKKEIHRSYNTVVLVEADDVEHAENKVINWFEKQDALGVHEHTVIIIKTIPKLVALK